MFYGGGPNQITHVDGDVTFNNDVDIAGHFTAGGVISSSAGSFAELSTFSNNLGGQNLGSPTAWTQVTQWLTSSTNSPNCVAANNGITASLPGIYFHNVALSFSGSAGTYTFALFVNGQQGSTLQTTIASGQPFPVSVTIADLDFHGAADVPVVHDLRVKCSNAGANFQLNFGAFDVFRMVG